jgi:hypothetical protein
MLPYLIAGAIGYGIAKLFEEDKTPKYADGGLVAKIGDKVYFFDGIRNGEIYVQKAIVEEIDTDYFGNKIYGIVYGNGTRQFIQDKLVFSTEDKAKEYGIKQKNKWLDYTNNKFEEDKVSKYDDGGSVLLAPNGNPSNLTPEQYKLVRTPAFKKWFGDWENDPANASKVVDDNGEPLIVYHATNKTFNFFDKNKLGTQTDFGTLGRGFYFDTLLDIQISGEGTPINTWATKIILKCFLNIKNPKISKDNFSKKSESIKYTNNIIKDGYDGILEQGYYDGRYYPIWYVAFEPNQIKLANGSNTTFDGNNPDIRFNGGGEVNKKLILDFVNQVEAYQSNHYGTFNRDNLVESYHKLPDSIKEKIKPITTKNLFRGSDGISYKSAISFTKNQDYAKMFGVYAFPFKVVKENKGLIDTKRLSALLSKMRIANEIGDDEGEVIVIEPIFSKDIIENIEKFRFDNGGLIAPNGKPSNLTPEQYKLVRTPAFKKWFGDWENDPSNASKVVDFNGEPLVVYHGSRSTVNFAFSEFNVPQEGVFFSSDYSTASWFSQGADPKLFFEELEIPASLNENSDIKDLEKYYKEKLDPTAFVEINEITDIKNGKIFKTGDIMYGLQQDYEREYSPLGATKELAQKKLYKKILNDIDYENKRKKRPFYHTFLNIRKPFVINGKGKTFDRTPFEGKEYSAVSVSAEIKERGKNDGVIIRNTIETTEYDFTKKSDTYIVFNSNQIKLADGSNTTFDGNNPDIRFDGGGETDKEKLIKKTYGWYSSFKDRYYTDINSAYSDIERVVENNNKQFGSIFGNDNPQDIINLFNFAETKKGIQIKPKIKNTQIKKVIEYNTNFDLVNQQKQVWEYVHGIEIGRYFSKLQYIDTNDKRIYGTEKPEENNIISIMNKLKNSDEFPPILLDYDFGILDGHHRFEASKRLKIKQIPVIMYEYADMKFDGGGVLPDNIFDYLKEKGFEPLGNGLRSKSNCTIKMDFSNVLYQAQNDNRVWISPIEYSDYKKAFTILEFHCRDKNKGIGTAVLEEIIRGADLFGYTIFIEPTSMKKYRVETDINTDDLKRWYSKFDFKPINNNYSNYVWLRSPKNPHIS